MNSDVTCPSTSPKETGTKTSINYRSCPLSSMSVHNKHHQSKFPSFPGVWNATLYETQHARSATDSSSIPLITLRNDTRFRCFAFDPWRSVACGHAKSKKLLSCACRRNEDQNWSDTE